MKKFLAIAMIAIAFAFVFSTCDSGTTAVKYTVTFDLGGVEVDDPEFYEPITVLSGATVPEPDPKPFNSGRGFLGWSEYELPKWYDAMEYNFDDPVLRDTTLFAYWEPRNTITFNLGGVTVSNPQDYAPQSLKIGEVATRPQPDPINDIREFLGWYMAEQKAGETISDGVAYVFGSPVTGDITLYAWWQVREGIETFTVTFVHNNDTTPGTSTKTVYGGETVSPPDPGSVMLEGHVLEFWHLGVFNEATTVAYDFDTPVTANITLTARWREAAGWTDGWTWSTSDDSKPNGETNGGYGKQTVFSPGGASRITNAVERDDGYMPYEKKETINGVETTIFNFVGVTKVTAPNRTAESGAQFPMVGWEAVPDAEMLAKLKTAYSYSFYVRLNSSSTVVSSRTNSWLQVTAVVTSDFPREQGYDYVHYYGSLDGDAFDNNLTTIQYGAWRKVTVVLDKSDTANFGLNQPYWMTQYPETPDRRGDFFQNNAEKIQWQIPLQHNDGAQRNGVPYDRVTGEYHFDFDFYGLELQMTK